MDGQWVRRVGGEEDEVAGAQLGDADVMTLHPLVSRVVVKPETDLAPGEQRKTRAVEPGSAGSGGVALRVRRAEGRPAGVAAAPRAGHAQFLLGPGHDWAALFRCRPRHRVPC